MTNRKASKKQWEDRAKCLTAALVQLRLIAYLSQDEVARRLGWLRVTVSHIESGSQPLSIADLYALSTLYNVDVSTVMNAADAIHAEASTTQLLADVSPRVIAVRCRGGFRDR